LDDPLSALQQLADIIVDESMTVPWDSDVFGIYIDISLFLHKQDVLKLVSRIEELNITLI